MAEPTMSQWQATRVMDMLNEVLGNARNPEVTIREMEGCRDIIIRVKGKVFRRRYNWVDRVPQPTLGEQFGDTWHVPLTHV